jgi:hypothetical protein
VTIDDPLTLARSARTETAAARALAAIEAEISLGARPESWYDQADEALAVLHERHPRAHTRDAYRQPPTLSPAARGTLNRPPRPHGHKRLVLALAAGVTLAGAFLLHEIRHHRRRTFIVTAGVLGVASGHPELAVTVGTLAAMVGLMRRRPGAIRPPRFRRGQPPAGVEPLNTRPRVGIPKPPRLPGRTRP